MGVMNDRVSGSPTYDCNGEIKEARIQTQCLNVSKGARVAKRQLKPDGKVNTNV